MVKVHWFPSVVATLALMCTGSSAHAQVSGCTAPPMLQSSTVTLVGEIHGTVETPAWVAELACGLSKQHQVVVALEIAKDEQERLNTYMGSEGTPADQSSLIAGPFWKGYDGRASEAMVSLVERLRVLSKQGKAVTVAAVDDWEPPTSRDAVMAEAIRQLHTAHPEARIVALLGNYHARVSPRASPKGPYDQPAGYFLRDLNPISVLAEFNGGTAWVCTPECGPSPVKSGPGDRQPGFYPGAAWLPGYSAAVNHGQVTPSVPVSQRSP